MNERNWNYRAVELSNRDTAYNFQITNVSHAPNYSGGLYNSETSHGAYSTNITAWARLFTFSGVFYGSKTERETAYAELKRIIKVEDFPSLDNRGFYTLKWTDKRGKDVQVEAKVWKALETQEGEHGFLTFTFALLAEDSFYYSQTESTATGGIGQLGGNIIPNEIPNNLLYGTDYITVNNEGDSRAGMYISVIGNLVNPRITNITTGQTMKLETTTDKLVVDNRTKPFKITNNGVNIKTTQKGQYIYLVAGENNIVVSCENYTAEDQADVYIKFSNTYE